MTVFIWNIKQKFNFHMINNCYSISMNIFRILLCIAEKSFYGGIQGYIIYSYHYYHIEITFSSPSTNEREFCFTF